MSKPHNSNWYENRIKLFYKSTFTCCHCQQLTPFPTTALEPHPISRLICSRCDVPACADCFFAAPAAPYVTRKIDLRQPLPTGSRFSFLCCQCGDSWNLGKGGSPHTVDNISLPLLCECGVWYESDAKRPPQWEAHTCPSCTHRCCGKCYKLYLSDRDANFEYAEIEKQIKSGHFQPADKPRSGSVSMTQLAGLQRVEQQNRLERLQNESEVTFKPRSRRPSLQRIVSKIATVNKFIRPQQSREMVIGTPETFADDLKKIRLTQDEEKKAEIERKMARESLKARLPGRSLDLIKVISHSQAFPLQRPQIPEAPKPGPVAWPPELQQARAERHRSQSLAAAARPQITRQPPFRREISKPHVAQIHEPIPTQISSLRRTSTSHPAIAPSVNLNKPLPPAPATIGTPPSSNSYRHQVDDYFSSVSAARTCPTCLGDQYIRAKMKCKKCKGSGLLDDVKGPDERGMICLFCKSNGWHEQHVHCPNCSGEEATPYEQAYDNEAPRTPRIFGGCSEEEFVAAARAATACLRNRSRGVVDKEFKHKLETSWYNDDNE